MASTISFTLTEKAKEVTREFDQEDLTQENGLEI